MARLEAPSLGCILAINQQHEGSSEVELARRLGCSFMALDDLFLCFRPERGEEDSVAFRRFARLEADVAGIPVHLLGAALRETLRFEREEEIAITQRDGEGGSALLALYQIG